MFVVKFFDGQVPTPTDKGSEAVAELGTAVAAKVQEYIAAMEKVGDAKSAECCSGGHMWVQGRGLGTQISPQP